MKSENEVVFYTYKPAGTLKIYNTVTNSVKLLPIRQAAGVQFARCTIFTWQKKLFINLNNRIYETDSSLQVLKSEVVNFQNQALSDLSSFSDVKEDGNGNLYVQTVSDGIKKVLFNTYPIRFYNQRQVNGNFIMSILPDKVNNRVFAGVYGNGLLIYDTLQRLVQHLRITNAGGELISPHTMLKTNSNQYLVFGSGEKFAWVLSQDLRLVKAIPIRPEHNRIRRGTEHFANVVWQNKDRAIVQSQSFAYKIDFSGNNITIREFYAADGYIMSGLFYPPYLITHGNNNLLLLDTASFIQKKKLAFENTAYVRCFATDASNKIYVGSNNGIFITDTSGQVLQHLNKKTGLADDCIYAMHFDESGHLWCSTNKGIFKIQKNRLVLQLRKEDGLQENEFNTNSFARSDDGELFFGGVNGISSFYPAAITINSKQPDLLFTAIRANGEEAVQDTAAWEVSSITMPYDRNALSFDFVAMGNYNPDQYIYQYRMDGVDQEWIQQDGMQTVRYSLRPGPYTFKIYASRSFDPHAAPMKEIRIIIHPPFWRSWWFNTLAAVGVLLLLTYFINQQNKRKYARQLQQHENERQLQQERVRISKDLHDSLGVYAHTVLYNAELLEKETSEKQRIKLVDDLKFVSKDIIVSLRETIWALAKETYPMEECFVRIRNFIQPLTRYYGSIVFKTEGEAPSSVVLPHANALNLVRIVQEAVSNSIKHASPSTITVSCKPRNGKWQVSIEDDGKGFDYTAVKERERGNGLNNIEQRSEASGFTLEIDSKENKGTRITITI
ncbi:MAG TPA: ATP-binding protein [Lacibacter sp.]|nr:ATP-binding protein [Lacibacter sp.]HMO88567.1 ATP-binding protein [Lacibacter sp.]HMP86323.1 ATP-binding protein [Lacibacter sp.]